MVATFPNATGVGCDVRVLRTGIKLDGAAPAVENPPLTLGQHTFEILMESGFDDDEIARLRQEGAT